MAQSAIVDGFEKRKQEALTALEKNTRQDTARINALLKVVNSAIFLKEKKEVMPYLQEAMALSRKLNYAPGIGNSYLHQAAYYKSSSDYPKALIYFDSALYAADNVKDSAAILIKWRALEQKGNIYYSQENYYAALDFYFEAIKYITPDKTARKIILYVFITQIYVLLNNLEKATQYAQMSVAAVESDPGLEEKKADVYLAIIDLYLKKNEPALATIYLDKMSAKVPEAGQPQISFGYYLKRGRVSYLEKQYRQAYDYFKESDKYAVEGGHTNSKSLTLHFLSASSLQLGYNNEAKEYAEQNVALTKNMDSRSFRINALTDLADYYSKNNNKDKAVQLMQQAMSLKDSLMNEQHINQAKVLGTVYEYEKQQREISRLESEKEKHAASENQKSILNNVLIASIIVMLIFGYLGYSNFKKGQQLNKQQQALQNQKIVELERNKQLLSIDAMLKGQEEERSRIAKDLHDGLGGLLSGTKLSFINVKEKLDLSADNKVLFERSLSLLDNTIGDLRKVAQNLMPEALVKFGLQEALRDFCEAIQTSSGIKVVSLHFGEKRKLSNTAEVFIYRMVQELVNNAVKHAEANEIIVQLTMQPGKTIIAVEDDGKGFDKNELANSKGAGMNNIKYRVQYFNGTIDIVTTPGNGTSVNIELKA